MYEVTEEYNAVSYEYRKITVPREMEPVYIDGYTFRLGVGRYGTCFAG